MDEGPDLQMIRNVIMEEIPVHSPFRIVYGDAEDFFFDQALKQLDDEARQTHLWLFEHDIWTAKLSTVQVLLGKSDEETPVMAYPLTDHPQRARSAATKYFLAADTTVLVKTRSGIRVFEPDKSAQPLDDMEWIMSLLRRAREA